MKFLLKCLICFGSILLYKSQIISNTNNNSTAYTIDNKSNNTENIYYSLNTTVTCGNFEVTPKYIDCEQTDDSANYKIHLVVRVKNISTHSKDFDNLHFRLIYNRDYEYLQQMGWHEAYGDLNPLCEDTLYYSFDVPAELINSNNVYLRVYSDETGDRFRYLLN